MCSTVVVARVSLVTFWLVCPSFTGSYVDYPEVVSLDLFKSVLRSEQANAAVLWPISINAIAWFPFCSCSSPCSLSLCLGRLYPPLLQLPSSLFLTCLMTWTVPWQPKEPSHWSLHRHCGSIQPSAKSRTCGSLWFNKAEFRHCWLIARLYEQTVDSYIYLIHVNFPSHKKRAWKWFTCHLGVISGYCSSIWKWQQQDYLGSDSSLRKIYKLLALMWLMPPKTVFLQQDFMH